MNQTREEKIMEWKAGDIVTIMRDGKVGSIHEIERLTATQVVIKGWAERFRVVNGRRVGEDIWHSCQIVPTIQAHREVLKRSLLVGKFRSFKWETVDLFVLERIDEILRKEKIK
jgi:hypothetical protein